MAPNNHHHHRPSTSRRKKTSPPAPAPPSPPPQLSFDDDGDSDTSSLQSSSEEDKEDQATPRPPPLAQQSKEDDDSSSNDEEQALALALPLAQHSKEDDQDSSSDDDDDNDALESEPEQPSVLKSKQNTLLPAIVAPLPPLGATAIINVKNDHDHSVLAEATPGESSKNKLKRVWTPAMQVMLMEKAVDYSERHGNCNISKANIADFRSSLQGCPIYEPSEEQILAKIRDVRKKHDNPNGMGKGNRRQVDPTILELVELSKKLWGAAGSGSGSGKKRKKPGKDDDNESVGCCIQGLSWEDAMVTLVSEKLAWPENVTRLKIASMKESTKDLLERKWFQYKEKLATAIVELNRVETDCMEAIVVSQ